tara:strand:+ start:416 stop:1192 length:777 start_codon:yes stop_codon:yes gene_type:complete
MNLDLLNKSCKNGRFITTKSYKKEIDLNLRVSEPESSTEYWRLPRPGELGELGPGQDFVHSGIVYHSNKDIKKPLVDFVANGSGEQRALLLDRDGILIKDTDYPGKVEDVFFLDDILPVLEMFQSAGYVIAVLTNQSGIGRGKYSESDYAETTDYIEEYYRSKGIEIKKTYYCPFHPEAKIDQYRKISGYRKPNPGMALLAAQDLSLDLSKSIMLGDKQSDRLNIGYLSAYIIGTRDPASDFKTFAEFKQFIQPKLEL